MRALRPEGSQEPRRPPPQLLKFSELSSRACGDLRLSNDLFPSSEASSSSRVGPSSTGRGEFSTSGSYNGRVGEQGTGFLPVLQNQDS